MWITSRPCLTTMRHGITPCVTTMCHGLRHASHVDYVTDYVHGLVTDCAQIAPLMPSRIASRICRDELLTTNPRPIHDTSPTHDKSTWGAGWAVAWPPGLEEGGVLSETAATRQASRGLAAPHRTWHPSLKMVLRDNRAQPQTIES